MNSFFCNFFLVSTHLERLECSQGTAQPLLVQRFLSTEVSFKFQQFFGDTFISQLFCNIFISVFDHHLFLENISTKLSVIQNTVISDWLYRENKKVLSKTTPSQLPKLLTI